MANPDIVGGLMAGAVGGAVQKYFADQIEAEKAIPGLQVQQATAEKLRGLLPYEQQEMGARTEQEKAAAEHLRYEASKPITIAGYSYTRTPQGWARMPGIGMDPTASLHLAQAQETHLKNQQYESIMSELPGLRQEIADRYAESEKEGGRPFGAQDLAKLLIPHMLHPDTRDPAMRLAGNLVAEEKRLMPSQADIWRHADEQAKITAHTEEMAIVHGPKGARALTKFMEDSTKLWQMIYRDMLHLDRGDTPTEEQTKFAYDTFARLIEPIRRNYFATWGMEAPEAPKYVPGSGPTSSKGEVKQPGDMLTHFEMLGQFTKYGVWSRYKIDPKTGVAPGQPPLSPEQKERREPQAGPTIDQRIETQMRTDAGGGDPAEYLRAHGVPEDQIPEIIARKRELLRQSLSRK